MEKRLLIALVLVAAVIVVFQWLYPTVPSPSARRGSGATPGAVLDSTHHDTTLAAAAPPAATPTTVAPSTAPGIAAETTEVRTAHAVYLFTNIGAAPLSATMLDYKSTNPAFHGDPVHLGVPGEPMLRYRIVGARDTLAIDRTAFRSTRTRTPDGATTLTYQGDAGGNHLTIAYTVPPGDYGATVTGTIAGPAASDTSYLLTQLPSSFRSAEADTVDDQRHLAFAAKPVREDPQNTAFGKLDPNERHVIRGPIAWAAARNKYFVVGLLTPTPAFAEVDLVGTAKAPGAKTQTVGLGTVVQPLDRGRFAFELYAGPQEWRRLHALGHEFEDVNPYGGWLHGILQPFATLIVRVIIWLRGVLQLNYGWVIIIFGIAIRILLWPLNQRAMRTSLRLQALQPELQSVQERYKSDQTRLSQEMMKVYKEHGLSPLSPVVGCLPMLIPLPILYCLLFVLQNTIEFRGVPFLWLHDISLKDPYYILPLLMGLSSYLVSWIGMRNSPPNPQAKMMTYLFPVMMTTFLANVSAGLNLYYAVQNLATLPQQWFLSNERAKAAARRSG